MANLFPSPVKPAPSSAAQALLAKLGGVIPNSGMGGDFSGRGVPLNPLAAQATTQVAETAAPYIGRDFPPLANIAKSRVGTPLNIAGDLRSFESAAAGINAEPLTNISAPGKLAGMFGEGGKLASGSLGRAGLYGAGGVIAGKGVNALWHDPNTSLDSGLAGMATGAGIGAGLGSIIPGVGTLVGGIGGGLVGGALGLFGPKHTGQHAVEHELAKQTGNIEKLSKLLGLDAATTTQVTSQLQALAFDAKGDGDIKAAAAQLVQQLPGIAQQVQAQKQSDLRAMAVQSAMSSFASPYLQSAATQSALTHSQMNDAAKEIGGTTGKLLSQHAQETRSTHDNLLAAYASQIAMAPQTAQYDTLTQLRNQANSQLYAKLAGQASGGSSGSSNLAAQISSLAPAGQ